MRRIRCAKPDNNLRLIGSIFNYHVLTRLDTHSLRTKFYLFLIEFDRWRLLTISKSSNKKGKDNSNNSVHIFQMARFMLTKEHAFFIQRKLMQLELHEQS